MRHHYHLHAVPFDLNVFCPASNHLHTIIIVGAMYHPLSVPFFFEFLFWNPRELSVVLFRSLSLKQRSSLLTWRISVQVSLAESHLAFLRSYINDGSVIAIYFDYEVVVLHVELFSSQKMFRVFFSCPFYSARIAFIDCCRCCWMLSLMYSCWSHGMVLVGSDCSAYSCSAELNEMVFCKFLVAWMTVFPNIAIIPDLPFLFFSFLAHHWPQRMLFNNRSYLHA